MNSDAAHFRVWGGSSATALRTRSHARSPRRSVSLSSVPASQSLAKRRPTRRISSVLLQVRGTAQNGTLRQERCHRKRVPLLSLRTRCPACHRLLGRCPQVAGAAARRASAPPTGQWSRSAAAAESSARQLLAREPSVAVRPQSPLGIKGCVMTPRQRSCVPTFVCFRTKRPDCGRSSAATKRKWAKALLPNHLPKHELPRSRLFAGIALVFPMP
jgi:hypothetical protein